MRDLTDRGLLDRFESLYRHSRLGTHAARHVLIKPAARALIRVLERVRAFDTSPIRPLPQRLGMLTGRADKRVVATLAMFLGKEGTFWDVGANIGYITRGVARSRRNAMTAYAFEPNPELRGVLERNVRAVRGAHVRPIAIGASDGTMKLYVSEYCVVASASRAWTASVLQQDGAVREHTVTRRSGDSLIRTGDAVAPDVLKIDVEGYEMDVLEGLREHVASRRNLAAVCEFSPTAMSKAGYAPLDLYRRLHAFGFHVWRMDSASGMRRIGSLEEAAALVAEVGMDYVNLLAVKGHEDLVRGW